MWRLPSKLYCQQKIAFALSVRNLLKGNTMLNEEILLRRKNLITIPDSAGRTNVGVIAAANLNLQEYGYTLSAEAIRTFINTNYLVSSAILSQVQQFARKAKGLGDGLAHPMYPNFPQQVAEAAWSELYINAILHYFTVFVADVTGASNVVYMPRYVKNYRGPLTKSNDVPLTVLNVIAAREIGPIMRKLQTQLVTSNTSVSAQDKADIRELVDMGFLIDRTVEIPNKENRAVYAGALVSHRDAILEDWFKTGTDVLRLATAMSDGDVSLAENTKFRSFKRFERRLLMGLLRRDKNIQESFARDRERFKRLAERLHPNEFKGMECRNLRNAFKILKAGARLETFAGTVEGLLSTGQVANAAGLLTTRPGEFARRLDHLLRAVIGQSNNAFERKDYTQEIIDLFLNVVDKVSTPVLLQVLTHFKNRNKDSMRVVMPKGEVSKIYVLDDERGGISSSLLTDLILGIEASLVSRFSNLDDLGKVYIDPKLKNYLVPFSQRSASASLRTITRGSKVPFATDKDTIRFFIHWKNTDAKNDYNRGRVDLDLSAVMYSADWKNQGNVSYFNLRRGEYSSYYGKPTYTAVHSGDITDAPRGAAEFIDVDIPSMLRTGVRYIAMSVNMFAGPEGLHQVPECFAGWMLRNEPQSGEVFEPKTVADRIDITSQASKMVVPMVIDLQNREMIWVDSEVSGVPRFGSNVANQADKLATVAQAFTRISKTNLYDLLNLHAQGRGVLVHSERNADTVFSTEKGFQFDLATIASEYLGD
ncbi:Uncharacterised protein [uncultured archaeon]|nr:Uncharacterised protein [uncultured archaeon]